MLDCTCIFDSFPLSFSHRTLLSLLSIGVYHIFVILFSYLKELAYILFVTSSTKDFRSHPSYWKVCNKRQARRNREALCCNTFIRDVLPFRIYNSKSGKGTKSIWNFLDCTGNILVSFGEFNYFLKIQTFRNFGIT